MDILDLDYIDEDVAYLLGLIAARGKLIDVQSSRFILIEFPFRSLKIEGQQTTYDQDTEIKIGLSKIRDRLVNLISGDVEIIEGSNKVELKISFLRPNMIWRNILMLLENKLSFEYISVPEVILNKKLPNELKREFLRGYSDIAGNIRKSNRYVDGRNRVRLDILNYPTNWRTPVLLCSLLQDQLNVPVQLITWGHPNMNREFREHQLNIFAKPFLSIGFTFRHKQKLLEELARSDELTHPDSSYNECCGYGDKPKSKEKSDDELSEKLDIALRNKHFDAYWQICSALGCPKYKEAKRKKLI